jgi:outer membrane protein assembly factor BamB
MNGLYETPYRDVTRACCVWSALSVIAVATAFAGDWPHWRGPMQTGASLEAELPETWTQEGENLLWHAPVGTRSAPVVLNDRVYVLGRSGKGERRQERLSALDLDTGEMVWEHRFNAFLTDVVYHRLGWANPIADPETGYVYCHGVQGLLFCFDRDGGVVWSRSLTEEFGRISGYGGRTHSPIIEGDLLIISSLTSGWGPHGKGAHRFWGMDKLSGEVRWIAAAGGKALDTTYAVPVVTTLDGARVMLTGLGDGSVAALRPRTGEVLWTYALSKRGIMASVVYADGKVYAVHGATNVDDARTGRLVCLDARSGQEVWRVNGLAAQYASPAIHDGMLYAPDDAGNLHGVDALTGNVCWTFNYGNEGKGSAVYADGKVYIGEVAGAWHILKVSRKGCSRLGVQRFTARGGSPDEIYATAAVAHGRVLMATMNNIYCISTKPADYRAESAAVTLGPAEAIEGGPLARIQLEPAETWLAPGATARFRARGFDALGTATGPCEGAQFSLQGLEGSVAKDGTFSARGDRIQAGLVTARRGDKQASARVRVIPPLPYKEDFEGLTEGVPPPGWITSKLKAVVSGHDGGKVLRKLAARPSPPFARLRCYVMPPISTGYTVASDMLGVSKKNRFLPDMGLINSRYILVLTGTTERTRRLRLVSWAPLPRIIREIEYPWDGDTWYRAKLSVDIGDRGGEVRAKVWPRGENEPVDWMLTLIDPVPNPAGSPGLYAYSVAITEKSQGTEVLFDNVEIISNEQ